MATIFFTGFPGFLGRELLPRVLARRPGDRALCLVQAKFKPDAMRAVSALVARDPSLEGRIELVDGDLVKGDLGLGSRRDDLAKDVAEIHHLAAVYDLDVPRDFAMRVNVDGTRHVLDFARRCGKLERHHYVSTCYVSGRYTGPFAETDLDKGQSFSNFYEETKFLAELDVAEARDAGMPTTVYRPSIVVGDHRTGATQKFDGPYFIIQWLLRQPRYALMPIVGDPSSFRFNVVPRDFVVDSIAYLSGLEKSRGKTYQICSPDPLTVDEMIDSIALATDKKLIRIPLGRDFAKSAIDKIPGLKGFLRIPSSSIAYFAHPTHYLCDQTVRDLEGSGISCPRLDTYLDTLVDFVKAHPEIGSKAMV
ncbi:MAG: SDR family oxidoreductase [Polyangiaceae bacterium]|nr:SDR family oxidoreductase [Polyangiaceae bacterium]